MNQDSDLDNDIDLQTDNEEEFFDDLFFLCPDKEGPDIEMLDQSLSVLCFAEGYGSTQAGSNL